MANVLLLARTAAGVNVPVLADDYGNIGVGGGGGSVEPASSPRAGWTYAAASGGITNTTAVTLIAAQGAGKCAYLQSLQVINAHASTGTEVIVKTGSTVLFRQWAGSGGNGFVIDFDRPLASAANTSITVECGTTGTTTYVNAQGFVDASVEARQVQLTPQEEIYAGDGTLLTTASGETIYLH